ncbi:MAG: Calx-beta domain-containing protein, partial [Pseudomonadota bacterium]
MECLKIYANQRILNTLRWAFCLMLAGGFQLALAGVEPIVSITSADPTADEAGPDVATFTVTRSVISAQPLTVNIALSGSAVRLADYQITNLLGGSPFAVSIPANQTSLTVTITPDPDNIVEDTEDVVVSLQPGSGYQIDGVDDEVTLTIADDVAEVNLFVVDAAMDEQGQVPGRFRVTRSPNGDTTATLTVDIDITGTATRNVDYQTDGVIGGNPLAVTIGSNELETIVLLTPRLDSFVEGTETVQATLVPDPTSYTVGADTQADLTLADSVPEVNLSLVEGAMDEAGPVTGRFRVTRTNAGNPTAALTVNIDITGTAQRNVDYNLGSIFAGSPLAVQIPANVNEAEFVLTPRPDNIVEGVEDVQITLQPDPSLYTVGAQTQADFTLADSVTEINLSVVDSAMDEAGLVPGTYRVTRTNAGNINQAITVNVDVTGTAAINTDYRPISLFAGAPFAVNLGIGETEAIFTFEPRADNVLEETETIVVTLQPNTSTYTVGSQTQADFTLADDPVVVTLTQEDDTLAEQDLETGSFLVTRSNNGDLTRSLLVNLEVDGTATQNVDYRIEDVFGSSPATTTIPANELEAR